MDHNDSVATSQRVEVQGIVLMQDAVKIVDRLGAELILPLPLSVRTHKLTGPNMGFKDLELVSVKDKPKETGPMDDFPPYLEAGHYARMD